MGYEVRPRRHSFVMPILLIGAGVYFLLVNLGYITPFSWAMAARFWPVLLIAVGLDILFGRRSMIGALISGLVTLLIVGGLIWLLMVGPQHVKGLDWLAVSEPKLQERVLKTPLDKVKEVNLSIDWSAGDQHIQALSAASPDLLNGTATFYRSLVYDAACSLTQCDIRVGESMSPDQWFNWDFKPAVLNISLHPGVTYSMNVQSGSGDINFDFSELTLKDFKIDSGSGGLDMALPGGDYDAEIDTGSGDVSLSLPARTAVRLRLRSGSGDFYAPKLSLVEGKEHGRGTWETEGYDSASEKVDLKVDQGSGDLDLTFR